MVAGPPLEVEDGSPAEPRPVIGDGLDGPLYPGGVRGQPRHDRRHQHPRLYARVGQLPHRPQPLQGVGGARLQGVPGVFVDRRHAHVHRAVRPFGEVPKQVDVAHDHRSLGDQADRRGVLDQGFEHAPAEPVAALDRLIRIGGGAESDELAALRPAELPPQHVREVHLDEDDRRELVARVELQVRVVPAGEAVVAAVGAAAIRVQGPFERHAPHPVEGGAAGDLLVARIVGPANRGGQGGGERPVAGASLPNQVRDLPRGRPAGRQIEQGCAAAAWHICILFAHRRMVHRGRPAGQGGR